MKQKTMLILLTILTVLFLVAFLLNRASTVRDRRTSEGRPLFPQLTVEKAQKIEIKGKDDSSVLQKKKGEWVVVTSEDYPADPQGVKDILEKTCAMLRKEVASTVEAKQDVFEVNAEKGVHVKVSGDNDAVLADFYAGKTGGADFRSTYVRLEGETDVLVIPEPLRSTFYRGKRGWRDRTIIDFAAENVRKIEINSETQAYAVDSPDGQTWTLSLPEGEFPAKKNLVVNLLANFSKLQADDWPSRQGPEAMAEYGLDAPKAQAVAVDMDGKTHTLYFGNENDKTQTYVKADDKDKIFLVANYRRTNILRNTDDLKETTPMAPPPPPGGGPVPGGAPPVPVIPAPAGK